MIPINVLMLKVLIVWLVSGEPSDRVRPIPADPDVGQSWNVRGAIVILLSGA